MTLQKKITKSLKVIKKASRQYPAEQLAVAWTGGKDSTLLLALIRQAFNNQVPFPVFFNDSTMEFMEIYRFIEKVAKKWQLELITLKHSQKELKKFNQAKPDQKKELSRLMKVNSINRALKKYQFKAFMSAIRWDEHPARAKEKYFSQRENHLRIHPILHFAERDVWRYIERYRVPYVCLYDQGYRSLGEQPFTKKAKPQGKERSGREKDKEKIMKRLRSLGYW